MIGEQLEMSRKRKAVLSIFVIVLILIATVLVYTLLTKVSAIPLRILVVTGEGLQETYGFYNESHVGNGYNYYRDKFWTESTSRWSASTMYATISMDSVSKVRGDSSILFDFNAQYSLYYLFNRVNHPYGYLAKSGDKWLYFSIMFNLTEKIDTLEIRATDYSASNYFATMLNVSGHSPNEWIRFKVNMNDMVPQGSVNWNGIYGLQFVMQLPSGGPLKVWIDDIFMTSTYHYDLALKNFRALFKGVTLDRRDYDDLPPAINDYAAVIYLDNRINPSGATLIDRYVNQGGGLILMGLSTLWSSDGNERVNFLLDSSPVNVLNTTETFIDGAEGVDHLVNHTALRPWANYTIFSQRGYESYKPVPYLGIAEVYNVSLKAGAETLINESNFIYEAVWRYGKGKVIYFAENLAKRIANGMLEARNLMHGTFGGRGWGGATADRLQLLESATNYVSKYPLPKILMVPFAKKGGFLFTVTNIASIKWYWYLNKSCTNILGDYSNDTAFWYVINVMKNQSEGTGVTFTLLVATEQLVNELRPAQEEIEFDPENLNALKEVYQNPHLEIGLYTSNLMTWNMNSTSTEESYLNMWQGVIDLRSVLNISDYHPLIWRYPGAVRGGESMFGAARAGLYLDVTDERGSVVVPYLMEAPIWKIQNRGGFRAEIEGGESNRRREETFFDWYVENDMIYQVTAQDLEIATDPSHLHRSSPVEPAYQAKWYEIPTFLKHVREQNETWIVGGVTLARYLEAWQNVEVSTIYAGSTYTFDISNAPTGYTLRIPLNGAHVSDYEGTSERILQERGSFAYLALSNPRSLETIKVTLANTKLSSLGMFINAHSVFISMGYAILDETSSHRRIFLKKDD